MKISKAKMIFAAGVMLASLLGGTVSAYAMETGEVTEATQAEENTGGDAFESTYYTSDVTVLNGYNPDLNITFDVNHEGTDYSGVFTPDGNLTLVDDLDGDETEELQYMTVQTKSGNVFYIIIDRSTDDNNVYFLNTVDEADLMALMDDDTKAQFEDVSKKDSAKNTENADDAADESEDADSDAEKTGDSNEKQKADSGSSLTLLLVFAVLGGGAVLAYYKFKIKPDKGQVNDDDELEFLDDDEYEKEAKTEDEADDKE